MRFVLWILAAAFIALCAACGGGGSGGGSGTVLLTGRVLSVVTDGPANPAAGVQAGSVSTTTSPADGSFELNASTGATTVLVDPKIQSWSVFSFTFPPATDTTDVGDLWIGPEKVTVNGRVLNSTNSQPVAGATVSFGGHSATTDSTGIYSIPNVAYSSQNPSGFLGITGLARATGFFAASFNPTTAASAGVVTIDDVLLVPSTDTTPPPGPYNIWGRVSPSSLAQGTTVTLLQNGNPVRVYTVGSDDRYFFWAPAGDYTISYQNGLHTAPNQNVTLTQQNQVIEKDVTLQ